MGLELRMSHRQELRQRMSLEQRLALRLKQELKLKMTLAQVLKLVHKLWPQLHLNLGLKFESYLTKTIRNDTLLQRTLPSYLALNPTATELQRAFPQLSPLFNMQYKSSTDYGTQLRQGAVVAQGPRLELRHSLQLTQNLPTTNWSLLDAYKNDDAGCQLPKKKLPGIDNLSLEELLKQVDTANEVFRFIYTKEGGKHFKVPLVRNYNMRSADIAVRISHQEYKEASTILEKAGRIQRIVRAVPYSEIRETILDFLATEEHDLDDAVLIGIDRGGRLPVGIIQRALGKERAYFLKVDQGAREIDTQRLQYFINNHTLQGKYVLLVDSTVDSGRQISALRSYFDDEDLAKEIGHTGWTVVGSNEYGETLDNHININWGLDPDQSFEDDPDLLGVDYAAEDNLTKVRARPTKTSISLRRELFDVPKGIILDVSGIVKPKISKKKSHAALTQTPLLEQGEMKTPTLLLIGDGRNVTLDETNAKYLALNVEGRFNLIAGTSQGNPGYILGLAQNYNEAKGATLIQPAYMQGKDLSSSFTVIYDGATKDRFRDSMIARADIVLALGGNDGTWKEIQKSLTQGKPTIVIRNFGNAGTNAARLEGRENLYITDNLEKAVETIRTYHPNPA